MFRRAFADGCPARATTRRLRLSRAAQKYVAHGWPVIVGSRLCGDRFSCGPGCQTVSCHPLSCRPGDPVAPALRRPTDIEAKWRESPYSVLLSTGDRFDVVDVPAHIGALAVDAPLGPVAVTPVGRWMFFVRPGAPLRPELACLSDVVLHSEGSWVPAPPVRSPKGRVRWIVTPGESKWRVPNAERVQAMLVETLPRVQMRSPWLRRAA